MVCAYCDKPSVCVQPHGPVCLDHLNSPPPQLDRIEWMLSRDISAYKSKQEQGQ